MIINYSFVIKVFGRRYTLSEKHSSIEKAMKAKLVKVVSRARGRRFTQHAFSGYSEKTIEGKKYSI